MSYSVFDDGILCDCAWKKGNYNSMEEGRLGHFVCGECGQEVFAPFIEPGMYEREDIERINIRKQNGIRRLNLNYIGSQINFDPYDLYEECRDAGLIIESWAKDESLKIRTRLEKAQ